jgi:glycosyltransferase involved in cell wall biosynthesis
MATAVPGEVRTRDFPPPPEATPRRDRPTVCQVLHSLCVGGAEVLAARLARRLSGSFRFVFVCLDELGTLGEGLRTEGFGVTVLGRRPGLSGGAVLRLARLLRQERVALVHAHQYTPFFYAAAARWLGRRVPVLFTEHGRHSPDFPRRKRILANRLLLGRRDRVVGVGEAVRQALVANEGIPAGRVEMVHNGIDTETYARPHADRARLRSELGLGADDLVLIQVARLDYLKDHGTAVRTLKQVVAARADARLLLVGDGPERPRIEEEVRRLALGDHVRLLGQRGDVPRLLGAADVFLLTSVSGIPLTVIEAMSAGLPVVATRVGGVAEVVVEGRTGSLAPAGDDAGLAHHVLRLAALPGLRRQMGEEGRRRARDCFSEGRMLAGYHRLYREMLHA